HGRTHIQEQAMHWYTDVLKKYAVFNGRAGRPEFWWFQLANVIVAIIVGIVGSIVFGSRGGQGLSDLYGLAVLLPSLGVDIRRLHDTDRSGWWILIGILPVIGWIVLIVFFALPGTPGPNRFGASPDGIGGDSAPAGFCAQCGSPLQADATFCGN